MGFFSDLFAHASRVARGQASRGMDALEDATFESTLKQSVRDMRAELNNVVRASAEAMSNCNRLEAEHQHHREETDLWAERARKALQAGKEDLARKALAKKRECEQRVESLQSSLDSARQTRDKLKSQVAQLRKRIEEAERHASTLIARKNAAAAQKKVNQAMAGVGEADNAFAALAEFEQSVKREEAEAQAYDEMAVDPDSDLEKEFAALDTTSVDAELEALKRELNP